MVNETRAIILVTGRVQGVFYRSCTRDAAQQIGVTGWVRNLPDGTVEAVFEGDMDKVQKMIEWCRQGSPLSRVHKVEVLDETFTGEFDRFAVIH